MMTITLNEAISLWSDEEIAEMLRSEPLTGTEIVGGYTGRRSIKVLPIVSSLSTSCGANIERNVHGDSLD